MLTRAIRLILHKAKMRENLSYILLETCPTDLPLWMWPAFLDTLWPHRHYSLRNKEIWHSFNNYFLKNDYGPSTSLAAGVTAVNRNSWPERQICAWIQTVVNPRTETKWGIGTVSAGNTAAASQGEQCWAELAGGEAEVTQCHRLFLPGHCCASAKEMAESRLTGFPNLQCPDPSWRLMWSVSHVWHQIAHHNRFWCLMEAHVHLYNYIPTYPGERDETFRRQLASCSLHIMSASCKFWGWAIAAHANFWGLICLFSAEAPAVSWPWLSKSEGGAQEW